jgi:hypothetical protein
MNALEFKNILSQPAAPQLTAPQLLNALLEDPQGESKVQAMSSVVLHRLVSTIGMADTAELLALALPEQIREILDLELWDKDHLKKEDTLEWLHFLTTLPSKNRAQNLRALDVELISWTLLQYVRIHLNEEDPIPDEPEGQLHPTPDGWFTLELFGDSDFTVKQVIELLDTFYRDEPEEIRRLLLDLKWELPTALEEYAYRWRSNRLEDLGFANPEESLQIYAYLSPETVLPTEQSADRALLTDPDPLPYHGLPLLVGHRHNDFWYQAISQLTKDEELQRLEQTLITLSNLTLAADRVDLSDLEAADASLQRLFCRLSLGLEYLSKGQLAQAPLILEGVALQRIARVGHSLTLDLRRELRQGLNKVGIGSLRQTIEILDPPLSQQLAALSSSFPQFYEVELARLRPFQTLQDLAVGRQAIRRALNALRLITPNLSLLPLAQGCTIGDLYRTLLVNQLLGRQGALDASALAQFIRQFVDQQNHQLRPLVWQGAQLDAPLAPEEQQIIRDWIEILEQAIAPLNPDDLDLRWIAGLILTRP